MKNLIILSTIIWASIAGAKNGHTEFEPNGVLLAQSSWGGGGTLYIKDDAAKIIFESLGDAPTKKFPDSEWRQGHSMGCSHVFADDYYVCITQYDRRGD